MDYTLIFFVFFAVIMVLIYQNKRLSDKRAKELLLQLESGFTNKFKVVGEVKFSRFRKLLDVTLNVFYNQDELLISGFDYYRDRQTVFLFHTKNKLEVLREASVPKYVISEIETSEDRIIIKSENNITITLEYKKYGKVKPQLKEEAFIDLIKKLEKQTL